MSRHSGNENYLDRPGTSWSAVLSVTLGVATMITSELLPVSLLTPMADGLSVTEGMAGQSVSLTALVAIFSSLFTTTLCKGIDRRHVVIAFTLLLIVSNIMTAMAPDYGILLLARVLLGIGMGGFWAISASLAMKLAAPGDIPRALSLIFGGVSVSLVISAPAGSFLETFMGWRGVFGLAAGLGALCLVWQVLSLPPLPVQDRQTSVMTVLNILKREGVVCAMLAVLLVFTAQTGMLTYIRPLLEKFSAMPVEGISSVLLAFGIANFLGTSVSAVVLRRHLRAGLSVPPLLTALAMLGVLLSDGAHMITVAAVILWGACCGIVPVAWSTWVTRNLGDEAEAAGSLQVAVMQTANTAGAAAGGLALDTTGVTGPVVMGAGLMLLTALLIFTCVKTR